MRDIWFIVRKLPTYDVNKWRFIKFSKPTKILGIFKSTYRRESYVKIVSKCKFILLIHVYNCCSGSTYQVVLCANRYDGTEVGSETVTTRTSIVHSGCNSSKFENSIAVLQLSYAISFTSENFHTVMNMSIILFNFKQRNCYLFTAQTFICLTHWYC